MAHTCPVCGYPELREAPRTEDSGPSYEICPSCRYQFGYDDDSEGVDYETWRRRWVAAGMPWSSRNPPPPAWDPAAQLRELESGRSGGASESGQSLVEVAGLLLLVAIIIGIIGTSGLAGRVAAAISGSAGTVLGGGSGGVAIAIGSAS